MKKQQVQTQVAEEDVDDVVEIALRLMQDDEGALSMEAMQEVGAELDIPAEYIDRAQAQLREQRRREKAQAEAQARQRKKTRRIVAVSASVLAVVILFAGVASFYSLRTVYFVTEERAIQVRNVTERRDAVQELLRSRPDSADKDAELIGAENRIRVEMQRYAEAAVRYNERAATFPGTFFVAISGLPHAVPTELHSF